MPFWLCYTPRIKCVNQCSVCSDLDRPIEIHVIESDETPACAVNGPIDAEDMEQAGRSLLGQIMIYFELDADGRLQQRQVNDDSQA